MGEYSHKQYILINTSLGMTKGKMVAQGAHASLAVFFNRMSCIKEFGGEEIDVEKASVAKPGELPLKEEPYMYEYRCLMTHDMHVWKCGSFAKISLKCEDENQLMRLIKLAQKYGVPHSIINDNGITQVEPNSLTAAAIGPFNTENGTYLPLVKELQSLKLL
jgi:peptidyl-tRNA hydrolase